MFMQEAIEMVFFSLVPAHVIAQQASASIDLAAGRL